MNFPGLETTRLGTLRLGHIGSQWSLVEGETWKKPRLELGGETQVT